MCTSSAADIAAGALTRKASSEQLQLQEASGDIGSLKLEHAANLSELESSTQGPFDVVVTDIAQSSVLHALIQARPPFLDHHRS